MYREKARSVDENRGRVRWLEEIGRIRLSQHFFLRDFLHSEIAQVYHLLNVPDDVDHAVVVGRKLCGELLEPLRATFGDVRIRSGYRSRELNALGNWLRLGCASNAANYAGHIWDACDGDGRKGATATIVIPWFADYVAAGGDWRAMAWWIHDYLPYSSLCFFTRLAAFNIRWREDPEQRITSWTRPLGVLTQRGARNHTGKHDDWYADFSNISLNSMCQKNFA